MVKNWSQFKDDITNLYIHERRTLKEVRLIMMERHGFNASVRSYRQRFDLWDLQKYNCKKRTARRQRQHCQELQDDRRQSSGSELSWPSPPRTPSTHVHRGTSPPPLSFHDHESAYYCPRPGMFDGLSRFGERPTTDLERLDDTLQAHVSNEYGLYSEFLASPAAFGRPF